jgi:outer membrane protein assembly factor BamB
VRPVDDPAGSICCIDLDTLRLEWSFATPATVLGAVVVAGEQLVVGCADGWVYVLDRQGRMLRRWDSRWPIVAAPCVTEDLVVVVNQGGWLHALDRRWLQPVWELRLGQPGRYFSSPVVASGRVLIGTERDGFHCLGTPDGEDRPAIWPAPWGGAGRAGCRDGSHVPPEAAVLWEWSRLRETGMPVTVTAPAAAAGDAVVAGFAAVGNEFGLACLAADGSRPQVRWTRRVPRPIGSSPVIAGGAVAVISGSAGDAERQMLVFDLGSGTSLWSLPLETTGDTVCSATPERLFVQESDDTLSCRTLDGQLVWRQAVGRLSHAADVSDDLLVAATASPPALLALDAVTGRRLWTCSLDRLATTAPAVRGSRIYFADRAGVQARSLLDGRGIWQSAGEVSGPLYVDRERFAYVSSAGELVLGAADTGAELSRLSTEATGGSNPLVAGNAVLWQGLRTMLAADLSGRNVRPFAVWEAGEPTAAAILHAGRVYLGIAGRGLVCLGGDGEP